MELSERLRMTASMVEPGSRVADVGCDHGYVAIHLVQSGVCPWVLAMDVNRGPLERAREHIREAGLSSRIEVRLSDGLHAMEWKEGRPEADTLLCAGIGGRLACRIMEESREKLALMRRVILQPQSEISRVRKFLLERGYRIEAEDMVEEDGKFYPMMRAVPADSGEKRARKNLPEQEKLPEQENLPKRENLPEGENLSDREEVWSREELRFGKRLIEERHPVLERYLRREESRCRKLEQNLSGIPGTRSADRREAVLEELADVRLALKRFEKYPASGATDPASETVDLPVPRGEEDL